MLRKHVLQTLSADGCKTQAIESELMGVGIPDAYVCVPATLFLPSIPCWIEFKVCPEGDVFKRAVTFEPGQYAWLMDNVRHGGTSYIFVQHQKGYSVTLAQHIDPLSRTLDVAWTTTFKLLSDVLLVAVFRDLFFHEHRRK